MRLTVLAFVLCSAAFAQGQKAPAMSDDKYGDAAAIRSLPAHKLTALLNDPQATPYAKSKACQRLSVIGDPSAVPAIAALLPDEHLSVYARTALEQIPSDQAGDALRAALPKLKANLLIGAINSIGVRRDAKSVEALSRLLHSEDKEVAKAALAALARIRPPL